MINTPASSSAMVTQRKANWIFCAPWFSGVQLEEMTAISGVGLPAVSIASHCTSTPLLGRQIATFRDEPPAEQRATFKIVGCAKQIIEGHRRKAFEAECDDNYDLDGVFGNRGIGLNHQTCGDVDSHKDQQGALRGQSSCRAHKFRVEYCHETIDVIINSSSYQASIE